MDAFVRAGFIAKNLLYEIAERLNLEKDDAVNLLMHEIKQALDGKDFSDQLAERRKGFAYIFIKDDVKVLSGKQLEEYKKKHFKQDIKQTTQLNGTIANKGIAKGIVKVIYTKADMNKIKKGDILVMSMTTPDFVPAMEKAAAFVTDEGGILCHAAIVSREMDKPCIIGTKIATKVLKDNDQVEVNAGKGIVKKIK